MEKEIWKSVNGYEGLYEVSNFGRVKSLPFFDTQFTRTNSRVLKSALTKKTNCISVVLRKDRKSITHTIHRLVATAFIENPYNKPQVNHKDGNRQNNHVDNLEWCTDSENKYHSYNNLPRKSVGKKIVQLSTDGLKIKEWDSIHNAATSIAGYQTGNIGQVLRGKKKTAYGFKWMYLDNYEKQLANLGGNQS